MNQRFRTRSKWLAAIALPGFVLRTLIPIGFMPMFGPGLSVQLILCEGYAPVASAPMATTMDMSDGMPMASHASDGGQGGSPAHSDHSACPYGASPALASVPTWLALPVSMSPSAPPPPASPQVSDFKIVPRAQSPRAPPISA